MMADQLEQTALPPRSRARFHGHDSSHRVGTALFGSTQSWPDQDWTDVGCVHSAMWRVNGDVWGCELAGVPSAMGRRWTQVRSILSPGG